MILLANTFNLCLYENVCKVSCVKDCTIVCILSVCVCVCECICQSGPIHFPALRRDLICKEVEEEGNHGPDLA